jgi:PAS domain S-box-containing protein
MKKILIVDDNSDNLYMLESLLKNQGLEVTSAQNGAVALEKARTNPPDIIIADILMPVMDGYALCKKWKTDKQLKHIPFIFYTATYTDLKDEEFALSLGAERFIIKPQEPQALMNIIKEVWEERYTVKQVATKPLGEEMEFFRQYNEILFKKLEKKMLDLGTANQELKILEEKYRLSFEHVTDIICMIDADLNVLSVSPSVERILGYKPQNLIGRPASDLGNILTPESFERAIAELSLVLKGETIPATIYQFIARDGTIKHGEVSGSPIIREGKIIGMISVIRDITKRKYAEEKLRENEKKYRELFNFLPIPVYEMDLEANITAANRAIYETIGATEEDLKKGFKAWQILSPEDIDKSKKNIQRLLKGEQIKGTEYTLMRLDGSVFPAIVISSVIYSNDKPVGLRGAIIDITERKQAEAALLKTLKELQDSKDMLVQSEKLAAIGTLSAGVAHEILNPLNVISMRLQLLEEIEGMPDMFAETLLICKKQIDRIVKITKDLSQFSRSSTKCMEIGDLNSIVEQTFHLIAPRLKVEKVTTEIRTHSDLPHIAVDRNRLEQVLLNLINNAVDAMEGMDKKELHIQTDQAASDDGRQWARITVSDMGKGISEDKINKIFDPFFTTKEKGKGTGLGLFICYGIIQDHQGTITAKNNESGGASFIIDLPLSLPAVIQ